jgi:hypothetical protein
MIHESQAIHELSGLGKSHKALMTAVRIDGEAK